MLGEPIGTDVHLDPRASKRDKNLFAAVFIAGASAIVVSKLLRLPPAVPITIAVGALVLYALMATRVDRFRLREDRAGDNAYYLGFLFTLTSLSYALWAFQAGGKGAISEVIANFALALVSTIVGLAIRVWLQQLREDPVEFEHEVRLALGEIAQEVRLQLIAVTDDIGLLRQRLHQEISHDFVKRATEIRDASLMSIKKVAAEHGQWLAGTAGQLKEDREELARLATETRTALGLVARSLKTQAGAIEKAELPSEILRKRIEASVETMDRFVEKASERAEQQRQLAESAETLLKQLLVVTRELGPSVTATSEATKQLLAAGQDAGNALRSLTAATLAEATALANTGKSLQEETRRAANALASSVSEISGDVVKVQRALVESVDTIRRELNGGRG